HAENTPEEATANLQRWLGVRAAVACAERRAWSDWENYMRWLDERKQGGLFEAFLRSTESAVETEPDRARKLLQELLERYEPIPLDGSSLYRIKARLDVAELILFLDSDKETATAWIKDLSAP